MLVFTLVPGLIHILLLGPVGRHFTQGLTKFKCGVQLRWQLLIKRRATGFPGDHLITYLFYDFSRTSYQQASWRNFHIGWHKTKRTDNAFIAHLYIVHHNGIHTD